MIPGHGGDEQEDENEFDASGENGLDQPAGEDGGAGGSDGAENEGGAGEGHARTAVAWVRRHSAVHLLCYCQQLPLFVRW